MRSIAALRACKPVVRAPQPLLTACTAKVPASTAVGGAEPVTLPAVSYTFMRKPAISSDSCRAAMTNLTASE